MSEGNKKMPTRLSDLEIHEISCVDRPANEGARVLLFKAMAPVDPLDRLLWEAKHQVSKGELAEAISMARVGTPASAAFWREALKRLAAQVAPSVPPNMALTVALATPDGAALLAALHRATT